MIHTARMKLVPVTKELLLADMANAEELGAVLGVAVPRSWPPDHYDASAARWTLERLESTAPGTEAFWGYYFVANSELQEPVLIGVGGFKGPPSHGEVELGYSIVEEYRRQGFATETVRGMLQFAFGHPEVEEVGAQTLSELTASISVLERAGFRFAGPGPEEGGIRYVISRREWIETQGV